MIERESSAVSVLAAVEISKSFPFPNGVLSVLKHISLDVPQGTWVSLIGPSGCGKTTLMRIMAGLVAPDEGKILVFAEEGNPLGRVAYMPQHDTLFPWRTALDNAVIASEIGGRPRAEARTEAKGLFFRFGLSGFERLYPSELSGGMRQRLALIRTFLTQREVLLLDEPLGALDALTRATLQDWLLSVWEELGKSILFVTHDIEEAILFSDQILLLSTRPAHVRRRFTVELPRPRSRTAGSLVSLKGELLTLIHSGASDGATD